MIKVNKSKSKMVKKSLTNIRNKELKSTFKTRYPQNQGSCIYQKALFQSRHKIKRIIDAEDEFGSFIG